MTEYKATAHGFNSEITAIVDVVDGEVVKVKAEGEVPNTVAPWGLTLGWKKPIQSTQLTSMPSRVPQFQPVPCERQPKWPMRQQLAGMLTLSPRPLFITTLTTILC